MNSSSRRIYLDNIRWVTIILVVIYHVFYMYNANGVAGGPGSYYSNQPWDVVQYILYPWFMILLFLVAGISSRLYLNNHSEKEFIKARTTKLLIPSTIGVIVLGWVQGYINMTISGAFSSLDMVPKPILFLIMILTGTGVLWFLHLLWIYSLLLFFIRKIEKGKLFLFSERLPFAVIILLGILLWVSSQVLNAPVIVCYKFGVYGMAFFLGYFVFAHQSIIDKLSRYYLPLCIAAIAFCALYLHKYYDANYADEPAFNSFYSIAFAWFMVLSVLGIFNRFFNDVTPISSFMCKKSFGLYVFHYFGISLSAYLLYNFTSLSAIAIYLLTGICGFAAGFILTDIISRIPVLRWCMLGVGSLNL